MTAELWLVRPCDEHGSVGRHCICNDLPNDSQHGDWCYCEGGVWVRLNPDKVVMTIPQGGSLIEYDWPLKVADIIDALDQEEE